MSTIQADSHTEGNVTYLKTGAVGTPIGKKAKDRCGVLPEYTEGALCYWVCGEIPRGKTPKHIEYFTRLSHQEDRSDWVRCAGNRCEGADPEFDERDSTVCGSFKIFEGDGDHHDLMMKVTMQ